MTDRWPPEALIVLVDRLYDAIAARDFATVTRLLRLRLASQLPREVREDALATSRAPRGSFRAPMQLLQFRHRMVQLGSAEDMMTVAQLELELRPAPARRLRHANSPRPRRGPWKRRDRG